LGAQALGSSASTAVCWGLEGPRTVNCLPRRPVTRWESSVVLALQARGLPAQGAARLGLRAAGVRARGLPAQGAARLGSRAAGVRARGSPAQGAARSARGSGWVRVGC
jgi:hypothetical protein